MWSKSVEQTFDLVDCIGKTEHQNLVARLYPGITAYKHAVAVAYQAGYGHVMWKAQIGRASCRESV